MRENLIGVAASRRSSRIELIGSDKSDDDMTMQERADLEYAKQQSIICDTHLAKQGYRRTRHKSSSQNRGAMQKLMCSRSVKEA